MDFPPLERVGEQIQNGINRANQIQDAIYQHPAAKNKLVSTLSAATAGLLLIAGYGLERSSGLPVAAASACVEPCAPQPEAHVLARAVIDSPPTTEVPPPELPPPPAAERVAGIDPTVEANIGNMKLSIEGYKQFLQSVDYSFFDTAQQLTEFNPRLVPIAQQPTQFITMHFTAFFRNENGPGPLPIGKMDSLNFVLGMAKRYDDQNDHKCCGINAVVDRDGVIHQFAPITAKLRHNKGRDGITTGLEFEAAQQSQITTRQYEQGAYMLIAMWQTDPSLRGKPFSSIAEGHGETRAEDRAKHPELHLDVRTDFMNPASEWYRRNIQPFINQNPEVTVTPTHLR